MKRTGRPWHRVAHRARQQAVAVGTSLLSPPADPTRSIILSGSPRSGTTWVASLLATIPGAGVLFEPLHLDEVPGARRAGFTWQTYVDPDAAWPEGEAFMREVLRGRTLDRWTTQELRVPRRIHTWVIKFVRANRLLPWLTTRFEVRAPVLIVRHPCAVVASRLGRGWPLRVGVPDDDHPFGPEVGRYTASLRHADELLAARWALDLLVPLTRPRPWPWEVIWFERLVTEGQAHLQGAFDRWGIEMPAEVGEIFGVRSRTSGRSIEAGQATSRWRSELEGEQIARIMRVVRRLGVEVYDGSGDPDPSVELGPPSL